MEKRKQSCREEGVEMFDDWLARQASSSGLHVEFVLEAPVPANEVELHVDDNVVAAPVAHECLRQIELDSESDSDDENDGGSDAYIDYLRRRSEVALSKERIHFIDPRELGEGSEEKRLRDSFLNLLTRPLAKDLEAKELDALRARDAVVCNRRKHTCTSALPSWEAFFGGAADILYYHPEVKADYTPFLTQCVGSADSLVQFFDELYFGTVPAAVAHIKLDDETRAFSRIRSLAYRSEPGASLLRRPQERPHLPVKVAPLEQFLKARGSSPARTWVSGLAESLRSQGAEELVDATRDFYKSEVAELLADPKAADKDGDYFEAWLRECHPNIYEDIDTSDPAKLRTSTWVSSESHPNSKKHRYNLQSIRIPDFQSSFDELLRFNPEERIASRRERVLSKIIVDAFQLCLVDVASILKMAEVAARAPKESKLVIVYFAGANHTNRVAKFWHSQGFSGKSLPSKGIVGKEDFEDDEPRALELPRCLHNLSELFPVPET
eukprot:TRINITY_DN12616_c0_g1_i1.p1 TRINITY_DN12616_c0_g1~~TRINITY_DN12616_c0_g1_i1.p1  ORF type:complete len:496 (+),score=93.95 TRINITY_DN12616_c0_g1_i1:548-2035(+)